MITNSVSESAKNAVGALFVCAATRRCLLNLRAAHKTHPLSWALWGGMLEAGETPAQGLFREISEEMGTVCIVRTHVFDVFESRHSDFRHYSFVCVVEQEFVPMINHEAAGYAWFDFGKWPRPLHRGVRHTFASRRGQELLSIILDQHSGLTDK